MSLLNANIHVSAWMFSYQKDSTLMATSDCITIPLTQGYLTYIDQIDSDLALFKWTARKQNNTIYAARSKVIDGKKTTILLHRIILGRILGRPLLRHELVDHIHHDGRDNRREELRLATFSGNARNRSDFGGNSNGYKGVQKNGNGFRAKIYVNGKHLNLGTHATVEIAALAYDEAALEHFGEFAATNKSLGRLV